jgi:SP family sugar:H+ symporter-like MFS transporter
MFKIIRSGFQTQESGIEINFPFNDSVHSRGIMKKTYDFGFILFISCVAALGGFLFGFDSAVINGTVKALAVTFHSDALGSGFSVASALLGCAVGAFYAGTLADKVGRRPMMLVAAVLFLVSAWGSGISNSVLQFVIYRLIGGLAIGAASVLAPAYISEVSPAAIRGRLASLQQLAIVLGILAAFFSNYFIAWASGGAMESWLGGYEAWRWMFWAGAVPAGLYLLLILMVPESPRYLVACGKDARAMQVLSRVWGKEGLDAELALIRSTMQRTHKPRLSDLLAKGKLLPIVWIGIGLSIFQQFVGIAVVFYYGAVLWQAAGFSESHSLLISILSGAVNLSATFLAIAMIDRIGRKPLLLAGSAGMFVSLGVLSVIFMLAGQSADGSLSLGRGAAISALVAAHLYIFFFAFSWGPVVWVLLGEMFSNRIRGTALAVAASAQWVANFVITMTFPMLLASIGLGGAYGVYTLGALLSFFFVVKWIKETRGKTLEEMSGEQS